MAPACFYMYLIDVSGQETPEKWESVIEYLVSAHATKGHVQLSLEAPNRTFSVTEIA